MNSNRLTTVAVNRPLTAACSPCLAQRPSRAIDGAGELLIIKGLKAQSILSTQHLVVEAVTSLTLPLMSITFRPWEASPSLSGTLAATTTTEPKVTEL